MLCTALVHRPVLTARAGEPSFACQRVPGPGPDRCLGKGGDRAGTGASSAPARRRLSDARATLPGVRPALRAGLLPLWRDRETIQIGVDPRRAVALTGVGAAARLIGLLDGSRDRDQLVAAAAQLGIPVPLAERLLTLLAGAGLLIDYPAAVLRGLPADRRARLLPELAAASLARPGRRRRRGRAGPALRRARARSTARAGSRRASPRSWPPPASRTRLTGGGTGPGGRPCWSWPGSCPIRPRACRTSRTWRSVPARPSAWSDRWSGRACRRACAAWTWPARTAIPAGR